MQTAQYDHMTSVNNQLIAQASRYYIENKRDAQFYRELQLPELETLATNHLNYWKQELRALIFNGYDKRRVE